MYYSQRENIDIDCLFRRAKEEKVDDFLERIMELSSEV